MGKAYIGRGVEQDILPGAGQHLNCRTESSQNPVFIAYVVLFKAKYPVAPFLPGDYTVIIPVRQRKISEMGLIRSLADRLQDGRRRREAHIGDPHVYSADPLFGLNTLERYLFSRETVLVSFHHGFKIVLHFRSPMLRCTFIRGSLPGVYVPGRLCFGQFFRIIPRD